MKNIAYSTILLSMLMIAAMVNAAPSIPMPFVVIVDTFNPSDAVGMEVIVRDITHPYTLVLKADGNHEAAGDWGNVPVQGFVGDEFEITVGSKVINTIMKDSGLGDYGIVHVNLIDTTKDCPIYQDETPYNEETCPIKEVIKEVPVEVVKEVIKEVPVEVQVCEPKDWTNEMIVSVFAVLAVIFGAYKGYFRFQARKKITRADGTYYYTWETKVQKASTGTKVMR